LLALHGEVSTDEAEVEEKDPHVVARADVGEGARLATDRAPYPRAMHEPNRELRNTPLTRPSLGVDHPRNR